MKTKYDISIILIITVTELEVDLQEGTLSGSQISRDNIVWIWLWYSGYLLKRQTVENELSQEGEGGRVCWRF